MAAGVFNIPYRVGFWFVAGGALVSTFAGILPDYVQLAGFVAGIILIGIGVISAALHFMRGPDRSRLPWPWSGVLLFVVVALGIGGIMLVSIDQAPPATIRDGLNVSEIRFTFDNLKQDRHSELIMRVFNGTGKVVELSSLQGQVKFNGGNNTDPDRMGTLPTPALRPDTHRTVAPSKEWFLILNQRVPAVEAEKLQKMIEADIRIHFDMRELTIEVVGDHDRTKIERLPIWCGVTYGRGSGFLREICGDGNIEE